MLYGIILGAHIIVCILLIIIVLIQSGRGGGLAETFSGAESIFGTKTNVFLTKATAVFAIIFFITCLSLAILSKQRSRSLISERNALPVARQEKSHEAKQAQTPIKPDEKQLSAQGKEAVTNTATTSQPAANKPEVEPTTNAQTK